MRNLYRLSEFKEINSIVEEKIVTKTEDDGALICGLCLHDAMGNELFVAYGGSCKKLERIVSDRIDDLMVLRHDNQWRLCIRAHSTTRCHQDSNTVRTPSFFEETGNTTFLHQTINVEKGIGIIRWYAEETSKRYGVVTCIKEKEEDDFDVFLHHTEWCDVLPVYNGNNILVFDIIHEKKRKKAVRCRYLTVDDDWSELLKVLPRTCVDIPDGRYGKRRINIVESLISTINLNSSRVNKEIFEKKIIGAAIELSESQKKECLINGTLPQDYFSSDLGKITETLLDNDLALAIKNSDEEGCFVEIAEKRMKKFSFNCEDFISSLNDIVLAFKSMDIQQYLYGTLLSLFPTNLTNENLKIISTSALYIWKHRNKDLPISLLDNYPSVRFAIWYGGGNIPIDRNYLCGFVEEKAWFVDYLSNKSEREINLHPLFSIAKKRLIELSKFNNDCDFQKINKWYNFLKDREKIRAIKDSANPVAGIFLWLDGVVSTLDMDLASNTFIYLNTNDQVRFIKRLIQKKAMGDEKITVGTFRGLVYADLELHRDIEKFNPNRSLDISTHVLVQLIEKFVKTRAFMLESELFQVVFTGIKNNNKSFKLDHYFDKCHGRCQDANCSREYSKHTYYWFPRDFCDAPKANKKDENDKEYYWCGNARCYKPSVELHKPEQWLNYTLWDIIHIFNLNTNYDESSLYKSYITFISQVNKFNQIAERLICKECGELLYPNLPNGLSNFHYYSVTQFKCINRECSKYNKNIYLNHCFHPEYYPIQLNKKLYDDDRYTHEGVCACALFEQRDRDDD